MGEKSEFCIKAGEFAKMCNTTRDTLRYYHKQGILVPWKDEENGYHYYSYAQVTSFYFILIFRQLGCSVADIQNHLLSGEAKRYDSFVDEQYDRLLEQREELEKKISLIAGARELLREIREADTGGPTLRILPGGIKLRIEEILDAPVTSSEEIAADITQRLEGGKIPEMHFFPLGASMDAEEFMKGNYIYRKIFSFVRGKVDDELEDIISFDGKRAAVYVYRRSDGDIRQAYEKLADFIQEKGLVPCSDVYGISIVNVIDPHEMRRYVKFLFVCV